MESSLIKLWKSLFSHLVNVVTNNVMRAEEVGAMFGSLLISQYSTLGKEVKKHFSSISNFRSINASIYVSWLNFYFPLFYTHYHTLQYTKTK